MLEYAAQVWHAGLTQAQSKTVESIQRRVLKIIFPEKSYSEALAHGHLKTLAERRKDLCSDLFRDMQHPGHKLNHLLDLKNENQYDLRNPQKYEVPFCRTDRYKNTFVPFCLYNFQ